MSPWNMMKEITRTLVFLIKTFYPWLKFIPENWPDLLSFLQGYTPRSTCSVVYWSIFNIGHYKCNSDRASRGNLSHSSSAYSIRDDQGNFFAEYVGE